MNKIAKYFYDKGPFDTADLRQAFQGENTGKTLANYLYRGVREGSIKSIKYGLYYAVFPSLELKHQVPDPFLIASKLAKDSVLAFHSALELHGAAYAHSHRLFYYSKRRTRKFEFGGIEYVPVQREVSWGVMTIEREGHAIRLTDRERTVLDCVDVVDYAGGLEELVKSLDMLPSLDLETMRTYVNKTGKKILFSKVGFLLEHFKERWNVPEAFLRELQKQVAGNTAKYFCVRTGNGKFLSRWNLIVPANFESLTQAA